MAEVFQVFWKCKTALIKSGTYQWYDIFEKWKIYSESLGNYYENIKYFSVVLSKEQSALQFHDKNDPRK